MKQENYASQLQEIRTHLAAIRGDVPTHRRESKRAYSFSGLPFAGQLAIWDEVWRTEDNFWLRLHAYFFLERNIKNEAQLKEMWPVIASWQDHVDDWGLCDALAKIYTKILVVMPKEVYEQLKKWNADENLWKRRQSVVSLLYYSRTKKQHPTFEHLYPMKQENYASQLQEIRTHLAAIRGDVPTHRRESKRAYSFSGLPFAGQLAIWDEVWRTEDNFWLRLHAYFFLERNIKNEAQLKEMWPVIASWQDHVDDWGLCDALAKIYTKILVVMPKEVYEQLKKWNADENLWKRRQSVVSLLYYSRTKKQHPTFEQVSELVTPLLPDKEYYVQKGVGWTLRELHSVYPAETLAWLKQDIKLLSSIAFAIAIEKMDTATVNELKAIRKVKS